MANNSAVGPSTGSGTLVDVQAATANNPSISIPMKDFLQTIFA
jgi:hypothetical protein